VIAHQNAWFIGQVPDAFHFEVQVAVHCANPGKKQAVGPSWSAYKANQGQAKRQQRKEPAGPGQAPNCAK
jgi:hypothetical protein